MENTIDFENWVACRLNCLQLPAVLLFHLPALLGVGCSREHFLGCDLSDRPLIQSPVTPNLSPTVALLRHEIFPAAPDFRSQLGNLLVSHSSPPFALPWFPDEARWFGLCPSSREL